MPGPGNVPLGSFQSRQRGDQNGPADANGFNTNLWKQEPIGKTSGFASLPPLSAPYYYKVALKHSLGYLNQLFGTPQDATLGALYVGTPSGIGSATGPVQAFPWLTGQNRPYVNPLELLLVPACSSSRLLVNPGTSGGGGPAYNTYFNVLGPGNVILGLGTARRLQRHLAWHQRSLPTSNELLPVHCQHTGGYLGLAAVPPAFGAPRCALALLGDGDVGQS